MYNIKPIHLVLHHYMLRHNPITSKVGLWLSDVGHLLAHKVRTAT
jgi:hypothetical protein